MPSSALLWMFMPILMIFVIVHHCKEPRMYIYIYSTLNPRLLVGYLALPEEVVYSQTKLSYSWALRSLNSSVASKAAARQLAGCLQCEIYTRFTPSLSATAGPPLTSFNLPNKIHERQRLLIWSRVQEDSDTSKAFVGTRHWILTGTSPIARSQCKALKGL